MDSQVVALGCEPLRASAVVCADKVLVVARDAGARQFENAAWAKSFAAAAVALLTKRSSRLTSTRSR